MFAFNNASETEKSASIVKMYQEGPTGHFIINKFGPHLREVRGWEGYLNTLGYLGIYKLPDGSVIDNVVVNQFGKLIFQSADSEYALEDIGDVDFARIAILTAYIRYCMCTKDSLLFISDIDLLCNGDIALMLKIYALTTLNSVSHLGAANQIVFSMRDFVDLKSIISEARPNLPENVPLPTEEDMGSNIINPL
jgi:hypothetical protein